MNRDQKIQNGAKAQQFLTAAQAYYARANAAQTAAQTAVAVDALVQDIEDKLEQEDKTADVARLEAAGDECHRRAQALLIETLAPPAS